MYQKGSLIFLRKLTMFFTKSSNVLSNQFYIKAASTFINLMKNIAVFLFILVVFNLQGQTNIDSLLNALPEAKDTLRLQAIDKILTKVRGTDKELAQRLVNEEYELARLINDDKFTAEVNNSNGIFKYFQNELDSSIYYFEKSLQSYEKIGNRRRAAYLNNNIGILYKEKGDFETSIKYHLASLKTKEEIGDKKGIATSKLSIANVWVELGDYEKEKHCISNQTNYTRL